MNFNWKWLLVIVPLAVVAIITVRFILELREFSEYLLNMRGVEQDLVSWSFDSVRVSGFWDYFIRAAFGIIFWIFFTFFGWYLNKADVEWSWVLLLIGIVFLFCLIVSFLHPVFITAVITMVTILFGVGIFMGNGS